MAVSRLSRGGGGQPANHEFLRVATGIQVSGTDAGVAIIFDLDGTLVDTAPDLAAALNSVLTAEGHRPVNTADLRHLVGHGVRAMFEHALLRHEANLAPDRLAVLTERFLTFYRANI